MLFWLIGMQSLYPFIDRNTAAPLAEQIQISDDFSGFQDLTVTSKLPLIPHSGKNRTQLKLAKGDNDDTDCNIVLDIA